MNRLSSAKRQQMIASLVEGNSIRATVRMTGVANATVTKLLVDMGTVCSIHQDRVMRDLPCERLQCDEWAFVYSKQKNIPDSKKGEDGAGDVWTWVAIDADTKLVPSFVIRPRDLNTATEFMSDLAKRLRNRVQLTTDGNHPYLQSVRGAFGGEIDYAQLIKVLRQRLEPPLAGAPLLAWSLHRAGASPDPRRPGRGAYLNVLCGAAEPHDAYVDAAVHR
jgi:hypothetical protein